MNVNENRRRGKQNLSMVFHFKNQYLVRDKKVIVQILKICMKICFLYGTYLFEAHFASSYL